jgi:phosphoenolpyruvate carboxykinase (GTP)
MAEHMLLMGVTSPTGEKTYVAAAFPSACGKTNFAMLIPPKKFQDAGWKITTVGDDIVWMWVDGRPPRHQPRSRLFRRRPRHQRKNQSQRHGSMSNDTIYTNVALTARWRCLVGRQNPRRPARNASTGPARTLDPSRRAAKPPIPTADSPRPMTNNPALDPAANDPQRRARLAIIFGGRRAAPSPGLPGLQLDARRLSRRHPRQRNHRRRLRRSRPSSAAIPWPCSPFIGYNIRDYLVHWFRMRKKMSDCPRIFHVNWFRRDDQGKFLWPGYGENMRVLKWIIDRCRGRAYARETPSAGCPAPDIDLEGLDVTREQIEQLQSSPSMT